MSWSDDVRCLYCDGRLPLYRKITHGQFCSSAHRKAYWQEQERLAVERLHQTHDSLQAYRDLVPAEIQLPLRQAALAPHPLEPEDWREPAAVEPPFAGFLSIVPHPAPPAWTDPTGSGDSEFLSQPDSLVRPALDLALAAFPEPLVSEPDGSHLEIEASFEPVAQPAVAVQPTVAVQPALVAPPSAEYIYRAVRTQSALKTPPAPSPVGNLPTAALAAQFVPSAALLPARNIDVTVPQPRIAERVELKSETRAEGMPSGLSAWNGEPQAQEMGTSLSLPAPEFDRTIPEPRIAEPVQLNPEIHADGRAIGLAAWSSEPQAWEITREIKGSVTLPVRDFALTVPEPQLAELRALDSTVVADAVAAGLVLRNVETWERLPHSSIAIPALDLELAAVPEPPVFEAEAEALQVAPEPPLQDRVLALEFDAAPALPPAFSRIATPALFEAAEFPQRAQLPLDEVRLHANLVAAEAMEAAIEAPRAQVPAPVDSLGAHTVEPSTIRMAPLAAPRVHDEFELRARLEPAAGGSFHWQPEFTAARLTGFRAAIEAPFLAAGEPVIPASKLAVEDGLSPVEQARVADPPSAALLAVPFDGAPLDNQASRFEPASLPGAASTMFALPLPPKMEALLPHSGCEPLDAKPVSDAFPSDPAGLLGGKATGRAFATMNHIAGFWKHAPRDLRVLVIAIPALIALVFHPSLPKVSVQAPQTGSIGGLLGAQLAGFKQTLIDRAGVALDEDFRSGLDGWVSRGNATAAWSFDAVGFVQPGPLALYQPSMGLSDYQMQFLGMIDQKALSWVVRATDFENYYVVKLVVLKPGPLPEIGVTRYAVIGGKAQDRADAVVPVSARADTLYRVRMDVSGSDFLLEVQGKVIDSWTEPRLRQGGVGFFTARGEQSRVRWVQVTHQYDMLGRLCAYLAPYNIPTNGSW